jgi:hypothetical protein
VEAPPLAEPDLNAAGLQLVETQDAQPAEIATPRAEATTEARTQNSGQRRSRRRNIPDTPSEPLQLVETRNEDSAPAASPSDEAATDTPAGAGRRRARPAKSAEATAEPLQLVETRQETTPV